MSFHESCKCVETFLVSITGAPCNPNPSAAIIKRPPPPYPSPNVAGNSSQPPPGTPSATTSSPLLLLGSDEGRKPAGSLPERDPITIFTSIAAPSLAFLSLSRLLLFEQQQTNPLLHSGATAMRKQPPPSPLKLHHSPARPSRETRSYRQPPSRRFVRQRKGNTAGDSPFRRRQPFNRRKMGCSGSMVCPIDC